MYCTCEHVIYTDNQDSYEPHGVTMTSLTVFNQYLLNLIAKLPNWPNTHKIYSHFVPWKQECKNKHKENSFSIYFIFLRKPTVQLTILRFWDSPKDLAKYAETLFTWDSFSTKGAFFLCMKTKSFFSVFFTKQVEHIGIEWKTDRRKIKDITF